MPFITQGKINLTYILIVVVLAVIIGGGILWWTKDIISQPPKTPKSTECSSLELPGYQLAGKENNFLGEISFDLNKDGDKELTRAYEEELTEDYARHKPILLKIFSGSQDCLKEEFIYQGKEKSEDFDVPENEISGLQVYPDFWGDGGNIVMLIGIQTAYGSGYLANLHFFGYENGKYQKFDTLELHSDDMYKFSGEEGLGREIIVARPIWAEGECHFCPHRYKFEIYTWDGSKYLKREAGTTKNKYSRDNFDIDAIIQAEPDVLEQLDETADWKTYRNEKYGFEIKYPPEAELKMGGKIENGDMGVQKREFLTAVRSSSSDVVASVTVYDYNPVATLLCTYKDEFLTIDAKEYQKCFLPEFGGVKPTTYSIVLQNNNYYRLSCSNVSYIDFCDRIFYTFKFLE